MATQCIVLGQSKITCDALKAWAPDTGLSGTEVFPIEFDSAQQIAEAGVLAYENLVRRIEEAVAMPDGSLALNEVVAMVDVISPLGLNAAAEYCTWDHLIAMLILTFPEIRWVFGIVQGSCKAHGRDEEWFEKHHGLPSLLSHARRDPLFDPTGLRDWVCKVTNDELQRAGLNVEISCRDHLACAMDDEKTFAYFHAYAAYRHGFRADAVCSWALMAELFGSNSGDPHGYKLLLEDQSLNFPDRPAKVSLLSLESNGSQGRSFWLPQLASENATMEESERRILITIGLGAEHRQIEQENRSYLRRKAKGKAELIHKPVGGIFDLWRIAGLPRHSNKPPILPTGLSTAVPGHGAPGKLLLIAETLVRRAETVSQADGSVSDSIKGAVLAGDAFELLGGRTPSTALDALATKHEMEVSAECKFVGVRHNIEVKKRIAELSRELELLSQRFPRRTRKATRLDAEVIILGKLVSIFQTHNQFDEEMECLHWQRRATAKLHQSRGGPLQWCLGWLWRYLNWLVRSPGRFLLGITCWLILGASAFSFAATFGATMWVWSFEPFGWAADAFFAGNAPASNDTAGWILKDWASWIARPLTVLGLFHFGVFISYVYTLISRK